MNRIWTTVSENKRTIITLSAIAGLCGIIAIARQQANTRVPLRRRNAVRRRARNHFTVTTQELTHEDQGLCHLSVHAADNVVFSMTVGVDALPDRAILEDILGIDKESADRLYGQMVQAIVHSYMQQLSQESLSQLAADREANNGADPIHSETLGRTLEVEDERLMLQHIDSYLNAISSSGLQDNVAEIGPIDDAVDELKALLYHIAEDRSKREGHLHRGIRCEECGETPIRSVRWHCLNCPDFDLCSPCKALTIHERSHVFAEIQIPLPVLAQPVEQLPLWYSGNTRLDWNALQAHQRRGLSQRYGFSEDEIDGLAAQFSCLMDTPIEEDASGLHAAIGYDSFFKSLTSVTWRPLMRSNMILERIFSFYDPHHTGVVNFDAFVSGIAYLRGGQRFQSLDRAIRGFDVDDDGYVSRADCIRLLKAKFEVHCHIIHDMATGKESAHNPLVDSIGLSSQPISSSFQGDIPEGQIRQPTDKILDRNGDMVRFDRNGSRGDAGSTRRQRYEGYSQQAESITNVQSGDNSNIRSEDATNEVDSTTNAPEDSSNIRSEDTPPGIDSTTNVQPEDSLNIRSEDTFQEARSTEDLQQGESITQTQRSGTAQLERCLARSMLSRSEEVALGLVSDDDITSTMSPNVALIWTITSQALNESLDMIFKPAEDMLERIDSTASERSKLHKEIQTYRSKQKELEHKHKQRSDKDNGSLQSNPKVVVELSPEESEQIQSMLTRNGAPTDHASLVEMEYEIRNQSLSQLLDDSGYGMRDDQETHVSRSGESNRVKSSGETSITQGSTVEAMHDHSDELLASLAEIDEAAQNIQLRNGHVCLRIEDIAGIVEKDKTGALAGLMRSWLEWASF